MLKTYSVSVRLRRVITETAHVSVPLTKELFKTGPEHIRIIDTEKLVQMAIDLGRQASTTWTAEGEPQIDLHPSQDSSDWALNTVRNRNTPS